MSQAALNEWAWDQIARAIEAESGAEPEPPGLGAQTWKDLMALRAREKFTKESNNG